MEACSGSQSNSLQTEASKGPGRQTRCSGTRRYSCSLAWQPSSHYDADDGGWAARVLILSVHPGATVLLGGRGGGFQPLLCNCPPRMHKEEPCAVPPGKGLAFNRVVSKSFVTTGDARFRLEQAV